MGAFAFRLEQEDGTPADPPTLKAAVPNWRPGDTIALGRSRMLRVVDVRNDDADQAPVLVVVIGLALLVGPVDAKRQPKLLVRPVSVPADTFPGRAGTLGLRIYNGYPRALRLRTVAGTRTLLPCRVSVPRKAVSVRLRPRRWTTVRIRRAVRMDRLAPNRCQRRTFRIPVRITATGRNGR
jgi:hypothetical protein